MLRALLVFPVTAVWLLGAEPVRTAWIMSANGNAAVARIAPDAIQLPVAQAAESRRLAGRHLAGARPGWPAHQLRISAGHVRGRLRIRGGLGRPGPVQRPLHQNPSVSGWNLRLLSGYG